MRPPVTSATPTQGGTKANELLRVENLRVSFPRHDRRLNVVEDVSFSLAPGEMLGIVGESGAGKSMTALAVMNLVRPPGRIESGRVWFKGEDLVRKSEAELRQIRGARIAMIFQGLRSSLNPLMRVGDQIARVYRLHTDLSRCEIKERVITMLRRVGIPEPERRARAYPHQLSGGMAQRVMIAMMIASNPELLIADEPTTGLDVTIQAQIFDLIKQIQRETGTAVLLITHDLGLVAELCQRVVLVYAGQAVETGTVEQIFNRSAHPYSRYLLGSILRVDRDVSLDVDRAVLVDSTPYTSQGCRFYHRCPFRGDTCFTDKPPRVEVAPGHVSMCHMHERLPWNQS
jgi:oligopeptide/dipeptide ABC transporter ATP-binding protein